MMSGNECYLSIVATSRNDDHGGNMLRRMQIFISGWLEQCRRHALPAELILVEWNPPEDRPRLRDALQWPDDPGPCAVRIIEVPHAVHRRIPHAENLPLFQMIAKNVGIRRAQGEFVLATNIDLLFSDELMDFFARRKLESGKYYRINRYDVRPDIPRDAPLDEQFTYCRQNIIRVCQRDGCFDPNAGEYAQYVYRKQFYEVYNSGETRIRIPLFTNACGDFTLMARQHWFDIRGYAERAIFSFHLDSLLLYSAFHSGLEEVELRDPLRVYHIEHEAGYTPEKRLQMDQDLEMKKIPRISNEQLNWMAVQMRLENRPIIFNHADWGYQGAEFPETRIPAPIPDAQRITANAALTAAITG
ncbi:MAG: hypothetical protein ACE15F_06935 [bacterium]